MWVHSLLPLLLLLFDIRLSREKHEDVQDFTIDAILQTVTCSSFCTIPLEFSSKFLYKISFSSCSNARLLFSVLKEKRCCIQYQPMGDVLQKRYSFFVIPRCCGHSLTCFIRKGYSHRRLLCSQNILPEIRTDSFFKEFRCSCAINKFRTGTLCRILNYSTEHLRVPGNYR